MSTNHSRDEYETRRCSHTLSGRNFITPPNNMANPDAEKDAIDMDAVREQQLPGPVKASPPPTPSRYRYTALFVLMCQSSLLILTMRYSRMGNPDDLYLASTAVLLNEILKIIICLAKSSYDLGIKQTLKGVFGRDHWKLAFPAALYVIQNNLQYVAASNLDAGTFQVTYQLKILTTASFSVALLRRSLKWTQWAALFLLTAGVALVQLPEDFWTHALNINDDLSPEPEPEASGNAFHTKLIGLGAVFLACTLSGLAGVYFEMVLKKTEQVSLWMRNIQLGIYSLVPALFIGVLGQDGSKILEKGFFHGYNFSTICVIVLQALGGILVALVVKYADNIMKNFATSMSIIVSAVASLILWGSPITVTFVIGASMVIFSTFWFSKADQK